MEEISHATELEKEYLIIMVIAVLLIWMVGIPCAVVAATAYASWRRGRHPAQRRRGLSPSVCCGPVPSSRVAWSP
jgi:hypothetical protein